MAMQSEDSNQSMQWPPARSAGHKCLNPSQVLAALHLLQEHSSQTDDAEQRLVENCSQFGLTFHGDTPADGNCFFHAMSDQLRLLGLPHQSTAQLRQSVVEFLRSHPSIEGPDGTIEFSATQSEWAAYLESMSRDGEWADAIILVAMAHMLQHDILVVTSSPQGTGNQAYQWIVGDADFKGIPIMLGHVWEWHYRSLAPKPSTTAQRSSFQPNITQHQQSQMIGQSSAFKQSTGIPQAATLGTPSTFFGPQSMFSGLPNLGPCQTIVYEHPNMVSGNQTNIYGDQYVTKISSNGSFDGEDQQSSVSSLKEKIQKLRKHLKAKYLREKSGIRFGKSYQAIANTDDIFVDLELLGDADGVTSKGRTESQIEGRHLTSYQELLKLKDQRNRYSHHILINGNAGCGKTTLISKIAYEWAKMVDDDETCVPAIHGRKKKKVTSLSEIQIVLVLDIRKFKSDQTLKQAIDEQLLPGESIDIEKILSSLGKKCLILMDGFDEMQTEVANHPLDSPQLSSCFVIVTTRPHMVDEFCIDQKGYIHVKISGFSREKVSQYIKKFFINAKQPRLAGTLVHRLSESPVLRILSSFPIILVMICLLWKTEQNNDRTFRSMTNLYEAAVRYLNKPFEKKLRSKAKHSVDVVLRTLGELALKGVLENNLQISRKDFHNEEILEQSFEMGLTYQQEDELVDNASVYFIHKTFQEYCAAAYFVSLVAFDRKGFDSYLSSVHAGNVEEMEYLLRFCCGLNLEAAEAVLCHVVKIKCNPYARYSQSPWRLPLVFFYEAGLSHDVQLFEARKLHTHLFPIGMKHSALRIANTEECAALSLFTAEVNSTSVPRQTWLSKIKLPNWFMFGSLHTMRILYGVFMGFLWDQSAGKLDESKLLASEAHKDFNCSNCQVSVNTLVQILSCLSLTKARLTSVQLKGEIDRNTVSCESLVEFYMRKCEMTGNACLQLISRMPSVTTIKLYHIELTDEVDDNVSASCNAITEFLVEGGNMGVRTWTKLLECMPLVQTVSICVDELTGEMDGRISTTWKLLKKLKMRGTHKIFDIKFSVSTKYMLELIGSMPSLITIDLYNVTLIDEMDGNFISPKCNLLTEFSLNGCKLEVNTLLRLFECMPAIEVVLLDRIELKTEIEGNKLHVLTVKWNALTDFTMVSKSLGICIELNTLMQLMQCMPAVINFKLCGFELKGEIDTNISVSCQSLKEIHLQIVNLSVSTLIGLLDCMPAVQIVLLDVDHLTGEVDRRISNTWKSIKELTICAPFLSCTHTVHANTMVRLLGCMPSLTKITMYRIQLSGDVDEKFSAKFMSLKKFKLVGKALAICGKHSTTNMTANTMIRLLGCLPSTTAIEFDCVEVIGEIGRNVSSSHAWQASPKLCVKDVKMNIKTWIRLCELMSLLVSPNRPDLTTGTMDGSMSVTWRSLKKIKLGGSYHSPCTVGVNNVLNLIGCIGCVSTITSIDLCCIVLNGKGDGSVLPKCNSIMELSVKKCELDVITWLTILGCMPSVASVKLYKVHLTGKVNRNDVVRCESLNEFYMKDSTLSVSTWTRLLECMPSVRTVSQLNWLMLTDEVDGDLTTTWSSLKEFKIGGHHICPVHANFMLQLIGRMPSVEVIHLKRVDLIGEVDRHTSSASCKFLKELHMVDCQMTLKTCMRILQCVPSTALSSDTNEIKGEVDERISARWTSLQEFRIGGEFENQCCTISASSLIQLICSMPSVATVKLFYFELTGNVDRNRAASCACKSLENLQVEYGKMSANTWLRLLECMPSVQTVSVNGLELTDDVHRSSFDSSKLIQEFKLGSSQGIYNALKSNIVKKPLGSTQPVITTESDYVRLTDRSISEVFYKPHLQLAINYFAMRILKLESVQLPDDVDTRCLLMSCKSLTKFCIGRCSIAIDTWIKLVRCMPSVTTVKLNQVQLEGDVDNSLLASNPFKSLKRLTIGGRCLAECKVSANKVMQLLSCMPSLSAINLHRIHLIGEISSNTLSVCKTLKDLHMTDVKGCKLSNMTWYRLLERMPSIRSVSVDEIELTGNNSHIPTIFYPDINTLRWVGHKRQFIDEEMPLALAAVVSGSSKLEVLQLDHTTLLNNVSNLSTSVISLLESCLPYLLELHLLDTKMSAPDCTRLFTLISCAGRNLESTKNVTATSRNHLPLQRLSLSGCKIGNAVAKLVQASQYLLCLRNLVLRDCQLVQEDFNKISKSLSTSLLEIDISLNKKILAVLSPDCLHLNNIKVLKLHGNGLTDETMGQFLKSKLANLTHLDLSRNKISAAGAAILARAFSDDCTPELCYLNLHQNYLGSDGVLAIAQSFQHLPLLQELYLSRNGIIDLQCLQEVFRNLFFMPGLQKLKILRKITPSELKYSRLPLLMDCLRTLKKSYGHHKIHLRSLFADEIRYVRNVVKEFQRK